MYMLKELPDPGKMNLLHVYRPIARNYYLDLIQFAIYISLKTPEYLQGSLTVIDHAHFRLKN